MRFVLKRPISIPGAPAPIAELTLREELCAGDFRGIKLGNLGNPVEMPADDMIKLISRLSGRSEHEIGKLSDFDFGVIGERVIGFFSPGSPSTTASSDPSQTSTAPSGS